MLNAKILSRTIGSLLFVEGGLLLIALIVTLIYREDFMPFTVSALIAFLIGFILKYWRIGNCYFHNGITAIHRRKLH